MGFLKIRRKITAANIMMKFGTLDYVVAEFICANLQVCGMRGGGSTRGEISR